MAFHIALYLINPKPLHIRFNEIDLFIRIFDGTRYLVLLGTEKYNAIYNRIRYLIVSSTIFFLAVLRKSKLDSYNSLPTEKILTLHNVIILVKSVLNKDKNHYYHKIFLEKCSYQLTKK